VFLIFPFGSSLHKLGADPLMQIRQKIFAMSLFSTIMLYDDET
jgi:hypothetical protein